MYKIHHRFKLLFVLGISLLTSIGVLTGISFGNKGIEETHAAQTNYVNVYLDCSFWGGPSNDYWLYSFNGTTVSIKFKDAPLFADANILVAEGVPDTNKSFIFTRNKSGSTGPFNNEYNRSETRDAAKLPSNFFKVNAWGTGEYCGEKGTWSTISEVEDGYYAIGDFSSPTWTLLDSNKLDLNGSSTTEYLGNIEIASGKSFAIVESKTGTPQWGGAARWSKVDQGDGSAAKNSELVDANDGDHNIKVSSGKGKKFTIVYKSNWTDNKIWIPATYSITYKDQGGGAFSGTHASEYPTTHKYGTDTTLKTATKEHYTFGGWYTNSGCTGSAVTTLGATTYSSNITLYAKWTIDTFIITLSANDSSLGAVSGGGTKNYNSSCTIIATPATGCRFIEWQDENGDQVTTNASHSFTVKENATFIAIFQRDAVTRTIMLKAGNNVGGTTDIDSVIDGDDYEVPAITATTLSVNSGYLFKDWTNGSTHYNPGDKITNVTSNIELTANARSRYSLAITTGSTTTETEFTYSNSKYTISSLSVAKGDKISLLDYSKSGDDKKITAGIHGDSEGNWQDNGTYIIGDEPNAQTFSFEIKTGDTQRDAYLLTKYVGTKPTKTYTTYVGTSLYTMTKTTDIPTSTDPTITFTEQYKATVNVASDIVKGKTITFKNNYVQNDFSVTKGLWSNEVINSETGKHTLFITGHNGVDYTSLDIYLKVGTKNENAYYESYVTGARIQDTTFSFIVQNSTNTKAMLYDMEYDQKVGEQDQYKVLKITTSINDEVYTYDQNTGIAFGYGYNGGEGGVYPDSGVSGSFTAKASGTTNNGLCAVGGNYNFFVKLGSPNFLYIAEGLTALEEAQSYASLFKIEICRECDIKVSGGAHNLKAVWDSLGSSQATVVSTVTLHWDKLSAAAQAYFAPKTPTDTTILECVNVYDYVIVHNSALLEYNDFMGRYTVDGVVQLPQINNNTVSEQTNNNNVIILVFVCSSLFLVSSMVVLRELKKRKETKTK